MVGKFCFGAVVKWTGFVFEDGDSSDKLLVILGTKPDLPVIAVLTTTKSRGRPAKAGCNPDHASGAFYFAKGGMAGSFKEDTWIELYRPQEIDLASYTALEQKGDAWVVFNLRPDFAAGIRNCLKLSPDTSDHHKTLFQ